MGHESADFTGLAVSNLAFAEELYYQYLRDPNSVDAGWRRYFDTLSRENGASGGAVSAPPDAFKRSIFAGSGVAASAAGAIASRTSVRLLSERVQRLVEAYREMGHLSAQLDPLGLVQRRHPAIALEDFALEEEDLDLVFSTENVAGPDRTTLRDLMGLLRETYCRHIGVELAHMHDSELRRGCRTGWSPRATGCAYARRAAAPLHAGHRGGGVRAVPADQVPGRQALLAGGRREPDPAARSDHRARRALGVVEIVIGMAHRGRLNVLANVLRKPAAEIFAEFQDIDRRRPGNGGGDVKYHLGYSSDRVATAPRTRCTCRWPSTPATSSG